jgi:site-specific recombinase XerD
MPNWIISPEKYLTPDETKQLRKTCQNAALAAKTKGVQAPVRDALIVELALGTGLRVSELSNLRLEDLYLKKGQSSLFVRNGKGGKDRVVQFSAKLKGQIAEYLEYRQSGSEYLFPSKHSDQITASGIQQVFKKCASKAGLASHYSIHSLRHTYAVRLYKASSYNLRLVQKQLGHSSVSTTQVYADVLNVDVDQAMVNLDLEE